MLEYAERRGLDTASILARIGEIDPRMLGRIEDAFKEQAEADLAAKAKGVAGSSWSGGGWRGWTRRPRVVRPKTQTIPWFDRSLLSRRITWIL